VGSISSWLFAIVGTIVGLSLMGLGTARIRRARRSGWIALAVDMTGVRLGASPTGGPRSFAWADVAAIVLFRETNILPDPGSRKDTYTHSIGVRLRAEVPGSPEDYERQLERARTRTDLDQGEREMIADMKMIADMYPPVDAEVAVSAYVPVKGWTLRTERFEEALATFAPDLTIIELPSDDDPTDWLNDQDDLSWILKGADERQAGGPGSVAAE
jgi:hypothetical protein